jgi:hypothetical protein
MSECIILRPIKDTPFSHRIWTKDNFIPSLDWGETLNRLLSIATANPKYGKFKIICTCGHDVFLTGGLAVPGFFAVKCSSCETEIMILDLMFKKEKVHNNKVPFKHFVPKSFHSKYFRRCVWSDINVGMAIMAKGKKYLFPVYRLNNAWGEDTGTLWGTKINNVITIEEIHFIGMSNERVKVPSKFRGASNIIPLRKP